MSGAGRAGYARIIRAAALVAFALFVFSSTFSIAATQTSLAIGIVLWAAAAALYPGLRPKRTPIDSPLLFFVAASLVSTALSGDPAGAAWNLRNYLLFAAVWYAAACAADGVMRRRFFTVLAVSATGSAVYGIAVFLLGRGEGTLGRTPGSFSTAMTYGGIMMLLLSVMLAVAIAPGTGRRARILPAIAAAAAAAALWFSFTRSSWVAMLFSAVVILAVLRRRWIAPALALVVIGVLLLPPAQRHRVTSIWDPNYRTNVQRIEMIRGGASIFLEHPVFGTGPVDLGEIYRAHMPPGAVYVHGHMHNIFLQVAVTLGIVGLAAFLWLLVSIVRTVAGLLRLDLPPPERAWAAGCLGATAGFIVNGLFEWNFGDAEVLTLWLILIGSCAALRRDPSLTRRGRPVVS
jgi:O-antigen ligase